MNPSMIATNKMTQRRQECKRARGQRSLTAQKCVHDGEPTLSLLLPFPQSLGVGGQVFHLCQDGSGFGEQAGLLG